MLLKSLTIWCQSLKIGRIWSWRSKTYNKVGLFSFQVLFTEYIKDCSFSRYWKLVLAIFYILLKESHSFQRISSPYIGYPLFSNFVLPWPPEFFFTLLPWLILWLHYIQRTYLLNDSFYRYFRYKLAFQLARAHTESTLRDQYAHKNI